ncbi:hypothetical protein OG488_08630 [Streptomyces sp. NBC_01460]|uniref:hypothetical protein n=1 Tax=Streptomyces sp. NBC_01460 TaxID=2903875 RepID=UPI002E34177E|nr:hypothetical protein [Streptomyces sp. NBC_01460]
MPDDSSRGTRLFAGGCPCAVVIGGIVFAAVCLLLSVAVTGFFDRPAEPAGKPPGTAEATRHYLESYATDGALTAKEIAFAARGGRWDRETGDTALRITVTYPQDGAGCYVFTVPLPLDTHTRVALPRQGEGCGTPAR